MQGFITFENLTFLIALFSSIFQVYKHLNNPLERIRKDFTESNTRLILVEQQLSNNAKIEAMVTNLRENGLNSLQRKVEDVETSQQTIFKTITRLETILEERLPKKII